MILVIACGNSLRQDDGAGLRLAEGLVAAWQATACPIRLITTHQLTPELALDIAQPTVSEVLFIDTRVAQNETDTAVQIRQLDITPDSPSLGHHLSPEMILLYAQKLFSAPPTLTARQMTIPGFQFGHGEQLSEPCQLILDQYVETGGKDQALATDSLEFSSKSVARR